jgi:hypothetical protein
LYSIIFIKMGHTSFKSKEKKQGKGKLYKGLNLLFYGHYRAIFYLRIQELSSMMWGSRVVEVVLCQLATSRKGQFSKYPVLFHE